MVLHVPTRPVAVPDCLAYLASTATGLSHTRNGNAYGLGFVKLGAMNPFNKQRHFLLHPRLSEASNLIARLVKPPHSRSLNCG